MADRPVLAGCGGSVVEIVAMLQAHKRYHGAIAETREARTSMNTILKTAVALTSVFILLGHAEAASEEPAEATTSTAPGVVEKVGNAVARGAKAAASGVERGVKAADRKSVV